MINYRRRYALNHQILSRETVFKGHAFDVEKLQVRLPDQRQRDYDLIDHNDSVTIVPIDENGFIWFVTQFRIGSENILLELPAGVIDDGEEPEACARREIREETGMSAGKLAHLGSVYLAPGYCSELNHIFLATDIQSSPLDSDEDEFLNIEKHHRDVIKALIRSGKLNDGKSVAALYMALYIFNI